MGPVVAAREIADNAANFEDARRLINRALPVFDELFERHPNWAYAHTLMAEFWLKVANDDALLQAVHVATSVAQHRALNAIDVAVGQVPENAYFRLFRVEIELGLARLADDPERRQHLRAACVHAKVATETGDVPMGAYSIRAEVRASVCVYPE